MAAALSHRTRTHVASAEQGHPSLAQPGLGREALLPRAPNRSSLVRSTVTLRRISADPAPFRNIAFNIYDWDKVSSNDHVGDVTVPLEQLLGTTVQADDRGLYPASSDGKLIGDDFHPHELKIAIDGQEATENEIDGKTPSILQIRAKFTPYSKSSRFCSLLRRG